ncbi:MAG: aminotransferase class III-fold pyridoxal phosphate-dependent enzyme [Saprospiraceae bacterium]
MITKEKKKPNIQHNLDYTLFSWSAQGGLNPIHADHGKGVYIYDTYGKKYVDFSSQLMNVNIGHGRKEVTDAVVRQMDKLSYVAPSFSTDVRGKLGKKLAEISPGNLTKTFFTLGGAEAIDNAIKLARLNTGRHKIMTQYRAYHGATMGAITAGGDPRKLKVDSQQSPNIVHVQNPYSYRCPWHSDSEEECGRRSIVNLVQILKYEGPENFAAIIMEGESGSSGCIKYPPFYLREIRSICDEYGILMIVDEVMSGFGRTGKWFGVDHHEVTPDIMCIAKGLTCGYLPLGGMMVTDEIAKAYDDCYLPLGLTYSAHPVSCATALAVLDIYENENLINLAARNGEYMDQCVNALHEKHPSIGDWRNTGLLGCIELVKNRKTKEPMAPFNAKASEMKIMKQVAAKIRELGMFTFVKWNFIFIAPPLNISNNEIDEGIDIISQAISIADEYIN